MTGDWINHPVFGEMKQNGMLEKRIKKETSHAVGM